MKVHIQLFNGKCTAFWRWDFEGVLVQALYVNIETVSPEIVNDLTRWSWISQHDCRYCCFYYVIFLSNDFSVLDGEKISNLHLGKSPT